MKNIIILEQDGEKKKLLEITADIIAPVYKAEASSLVYVA